MVDMGWIEERLRRGGTMNGLSLPEEQLLRAYARERGLSAEALRRRWVAEGPVKPPVAARPARVETSLASSDLDYWADDVEPPDDDDPMEPMTRLCPVCNGRGRDHSGDSCARCNGTGRIDVDDVDDGDKDDEEE
jgi:hypothetical protein